MDNTTLGQSQAIKLVQTEKTAWESAYAFVTEKVAFNMREVIRQCKKNYWGVFDNPKDESTGRDKIWQHLTKQFVDFVVKTIDLDSKDVDVRARHPSANALTSIVRSILRNKLDETNFGEFLNLLLRKLAIEGTVVITTELKGKKIEAEMVDLLNFYIDPTAPSIAKADSVIERIVLPLAEFQRLAQKNKWSNPDVKGSGNVARTDDMFGARGNKPDTDLLSVELFRRRGWAPKSVLTDNEEDVELIPTEIICSRSGEGYVFHDASKRKDNENKGYEEIWYTRIHGRWYGEGVAERLVQYQTWYNAIRNIRINRAYVSQLGLFLIRKGSGVTPQMLSRLSANGAIPVGDVNNDIKQFPMQDASAASYKDDDVIYQEAQRTTGAFDSVAGEPLPSSTPATNAAIQNQSGQSGFALIREGVGLGLERWIENQFFPLVAQTLTIGDLIRMHCTEEQLKELDEQNVNKLMYEQLAAIQEAGLFVDPNQAQMEIQRALAQLKSHGTDRYVELLQDIDLFNYDVKVYVTNEGIDKSVISSQLGTAMQVAGSLGMMDLVITLMKEQFDLMGLDSSNIKLPQQPMAPGQNQQQQMNPQTQPGSNPTKRLPTTLAGITPPAVTLEPNGR